MLAKKNKLPTRNLKYTLRKGYLSYSKFFVIRTSESRENNTQFATIISKKISKKAVIRNKLKRQIFEAIKPNLNTAQPQQTVIIPKKNISTATFNDIKLDINNYLNKYKNEKQSK